MGSGSWTATSFVDYSKSKGEIVTSDGTLDMSGKTAQSVYRKRTLAPEMDIRGKIRECRDNDEHPCTVPVILALDVTGSMGQSALEVASKLNTVMTELFKQVKDVEFMVMAIGDLAYDKAPIQVSQFESDVRIAEHLDKVYFEAGGGANPYESYTAAWYVGLHHTNLDCWKRGRRGLIITMGDEPLNPYLPHAELNQCTGADNQADIETGILAKQVGEKFSLAHIHVNHGNASIKRAQTVSETWREIPNLTFLESDVEGIADAIVKLVVSHANGEDGPCAVAKEPANSASSGEISW